MRRLVRETSLFASDFILPLFVQEGASEPIEHLPGVNRLSIDSLVAEAREAHQMGIQAVLLFPAVSPSLKDPDGSEALNPDGLFPKTIRAVKESLPSLCVMADVALDPFTSHGHDGLLGQDGDVVNDQTVAVLAEMSVMLAQAGADVVAPSDMMDGRVARIRQELDRAGYHRVSIMAYSAKYASALYGPFRQALGSAPLKGDKRTYQMDPGNAREALLEASLDEREGADIVMIKPALAYLDVIRAVREQTALPVAGFQVSGEYAMIKAAHDRGFLDGDAVMCECIMGIKRAGADLIISYAAKELAQQILREAP